MLNILSVILPKMKHLKSVSARMNLKPKHYLYVFLKLLILGLLFFFFFSRYKPLILILIFEAFDLLKNTCEQKGVFGHASFNLPVDLIFIFGITASYYYGFGVGLIVFLMGILNRIVFSRLEIRHIAKLSRFFFLFLIITLLKGINFFYAAMILLIVNNILKFISEIWFSGVIAIEKYYYYLMNFIASIFFFYIISVLYAAFPFLA
jgi:hypothetical protein